jgi:hypothetical protein
MIIRGGTTPPVWQASGNRGVRRNVHEIPCEARVMVLEMRGVAPPHVQRGGGGGAALKKRGGPLPPAGFLGGGGTPLGGHGRLMRLPSEVHRKRWPDLWSDGGYPLPFPRKEGVPIRFEGGAYPPPPTT